MPTEIHTDALVIGAGPAGLYAAFQLGLLGLDAHIVDALPTVGGQCEALYADKPIYDIPAMPHTTGRELAAGLLAQLAQIQAFTPLENRLHLGQTITSVAQGLAENTYRISSTQGQIFIARSIILAAGVGAFAPRSLNLPALAEVAADCLHHRPSAAADFAGQCVLIVGDEDEAVNWACDLAEYFSAQPHAAQGASVVLNHRRASLNASTAVQARLDDLLAQGALRFQAGMIQGLQHSQGQLQALQLLLPDGKPLTLPCTRLGIVLGLSPKMGPLADWGLALQRRQLSVDSASFATNLPGIFAVGDVVIYPGKLKLIACAFHEATLAAHAALAYCAPDRLTPLQYTSSSALLQSRLGKA
jgi:thioredoxin reductase (NADPH)